MLRDGISPRRYISGLIVLAVLSAAMAWWAGQGRQSLAGRSVEFYEAHATGWEVACDNATDGSDPGCYVQYVDVYRPRPEFAAAMVELVMQPGSDGRPDPHIRFDIEPELSFRAARIAVETARGATLIDVTGCATNTCRMSGDRARAILDLWRNGDAVLLEIDEDRGTPARLRWPLDGIEAVLAEFDAQRAARGLP